MLNETERDAINHALLAMCKAMYQLDSKRAEILVNACNELKLVLAKDTQQKRQHARHELTAQLIADESAAYAPEWNQ